LNSARVSKVKLEPEAQKEMEAWAVIFAGLL